VVAAALVPTMTDIRVLPADDATNGWNRILPARTPRPPLAGDRRADWAVVGAGYAGLAAARRLAENRPNDRILLLEAQEVGENASARNSGFAIDLPHNVGSSLDELDGSHRYLRLSRAAIDQLDRLVKAAGIECQWGQRGKYHAAVSERGRAQVLEPFARELQALGEPYRGLDATELRREIGTPYYHAAVYTPGCALMNPAALTRGLADSLPENVTLCERSPVVRVGYENGVRLETSGGSVFAPKLILCTNGFAEAFGFYARRLLVFAAFASLTRPLTPVECAALGGEDDWGLTPANAFAGCTMRYTRDHRILIRQHIDYRPGFRVGAAHYRAVRRDHEAAFRARFPMLPTVTFEHSWAGFVTLSRNSAPGFGRVAPSVYAAVCCNAVGVTKSTIAGLLAADMACGVDNPLIADMESLGQPQALPPQPFLGLGVRLRQRWELWKNRGER
jgi:glycine/D-amino acid oxidase-like deaminating enzyme